MMNCFEARQDFPAFWRKAIAAERRAELLRHLAGCAKCDHAFRLFALSAPVLYGDRQAEHTPAVESREFSLLDRPRRFTPVPERIEQPRQWLRMSAAAAVLLLASSAAYFSARSSHDTLADALSRPDAVSTSEASADSFAPETPISESDLAS
jgi:hypothetical protein